MFQHFLSAIIRESLYSYQLKLCPSCVSCWDPCLKRWRGPFVYSRKMKQRNGSQQCCGEGEGMFKNSTWSSRIQHSRSSMSLVMFHGVCRIFVLPIWILKLSICPVPLPQFCSYLTRELSQHSRAITCAAAPSAVFSLQVQRPLFLLLNAGNCTTELTA